MSEKSQKKSIFFSENAQNFFGEDAQNPDEGPQTTDYLFLFFKTEGRIKSETEMVHKKHQNAGKLFIISWGKMPRTQTMFVDFYQKRNKDKTFVLEEGPPDYMFYFFEK